MAHPPPYPDRGDETGVGPDARPNPGAPRWVVVVGILVAVGLIALFVALHFSGAMGPGAH